MKLYGQCDLRSACFLHRVHYPLRHLAVDYPQHVWQLSHIDPDKDFDVCWLYGCLFMSNLPQIMRWRRGGKKLVFGLDDLIWQFPEWRRDETPAESVVTVDVLCEISDHLIASTPYLAQAMGHPERTTVAPNLVDVAAYRLPAPPQDDERIRICWSGAASHGGDLKLIDNACCRILQKYGERVEFIFIGAGPDRTLRDYWMKGARLIHWQALEFYWDTINHFKPHVCLSPLVECPFNLAKSNIRVLESWACNAALVTSPVGEYKIVRNEVDGLTASSEDEWVDCMSRLIDNREYRESLATAGYERVRADWDWNSKLARQKWSASVEAIESLLA